jgi:hypothetical protein
MESESHSPVFEETTTLLAGGGLITMVLFPFAVPLLLLTALAALPLVLGALVGGLVAAPFLLVRRLLRGRKGVPRIARSFGLCRRLT